MKSEKEVQAEIQRRLQLNAPIRPCRPDGDCLYCAANGGLGCDCPKCHPSKHPTLATAYERYKKGYEEAMQHALQQVGIIETLKAERDRVLDCHENEHGPIICDSCVACLKLKGQSRLKDNQRLVEIGKKLLRLVIQSTRGHEDIIEEARRMFPG